MKTPLTPFGEKLAKITGELKKVRKTGAHRFRLEAHPDGTLKLGFRTLKKVEKVILATFEPTQAQEATQTLTAVVHELNASEK